MKEGTSVVLAETLPVWLEGAVIEAVLMPASYIAKMEASTMRPTAATANQILALGAIQLPAGPLEAARTLTDPTSPSS